jgi:hypothetical protein
MASVISATPNNELPREPSQSRGSWMRLPLRHHECRYPRADRNTQSGGVQRKPGLEIWPHLAILPGQVSLWIYMVVIYYFC